jgi:hypothetical protein
MVMATVHLVTRWYPTVTTRQLYDCATPRRADIGNDFAVAADGRPLDPDWVTLPADDPIRRVACEPENRRPNGPA